MTRTSVRANITNVFIFANHRARYLSAALAELVQCDAVQRGDAEVVILADRPSLVQALHVRHTLRDVAKISVTPTLIHRRGNSYWRKLAHLADSTSKYVVKCDEDIFMTSASWDSLLSQTPEKGVVLTPILSTGIPTVEYFLESCNDKIFVSEIRRIFESQLIPNAWGQDYSTLKPYTSSNRAPYFQSVDRLSTNLKGVHPIRFSSEAQWRLAQHCAEQSWWRTPLSPKRVEMEYPYLCNSLILTSPAVYADLIKDVKVGRREFDGYDEIGLNMQAQEGRLSVEVLLGCHGVHPSYNSIGPEYVEISDFVFREVPRR